MSWIFEALESRMLIAEIVVGFQQWAMLGLRVHLGSEQLE